jgi:hypothetical protein
LARTDLFDRSKLASKQPTIFRGEPIGLALFLAAI